MSKVQCWLLVNDRACWHGSQLFPFLFFSLAQHCTWNDSDPVRIWSHVSRSCTAGYLGSILSPIGTCNKISYWDILYPSKTKIFDMITHLSKDKWFYWITTLHTSSAYPWCTSIFQEMSKYKSRCPQFGHIPVINLYMSSDLRISFVRVS